jgi:DNA repair protein RecN (Recombination protein N)
VSKVDHDGVPASRVELLEHGERVREIARMLGGVRITPTTLEHAAEMLREARRPSSNA